METLTTDHSGIDQNLRWQLGKLKALNRLRGMRTISSAQDRLVMIDGKQYLSFCSNNYLGLANHPKLKEAAARAIEKYGWGAGASRLISGNFELHEELEQKIARFKGSEAAILFPTGYMANVGTIAAMVGPADAVICDRLNHASIIDAIRMSQARLLVYKHCDCESLEDALKRARKYRRRLVVTDTIFSMDGDVAPLNAIILIARRYGAMLMVDEAHATGFLGQHGSGAIEHFRLENKVDIVMGTLSKAVGSIGGYVAANSTIVTYLKNRARTFIYTTALPPAACAASIAGIEMIEQNPQLVDSLWHNSQYLRSALTARDIDIQQSTTQIVPIITGETEPSLELSQKLYQAGILAPAIRPPTVPRGKSRIRISLMAQHTTEDIDKLVNLIPPPNKKKSITIK